MKSIVFAFLIILSGCAGVIRPPHIETLTASLPASDRERLFATYSSESDSYQSIGFMSHIECQGLGKFYETLASPGAKPINFIGPARALYTTMMLDAGWISKRWSEAINDRLDFNRALSIRASECELRKTKDNLSSAMTRLKTMAKTADDKRIFEVLSDLQSRVSRIDGSLLNFNQAIASIKTEFTRADASYGMKG